ncbi:MULTISPECIES: PhzF family phenazine biosynthesis protein [Photorhabdus]|uniref:PhzF family phenazine biosynthesis protein n=1 Tax=Photorhabdus TaxID=29487 RepID=UPI001864F0D2|nr:MULTISPECIES: PhzF family phenazine biosynthesis protein [Photorhabdus]MCT8345446.1 PhzF family phenazine biosynthesis protein [Photorhabdus kleinii]
MTLLPIYHVDAFTDHPFSGNPAAVVILDNWLPDETLLSIATEINLSETAFLVGNHLRWFTPKVEVDLCGHATLATAFVMVEYLSVTDNPIVFQTHSGDIAVYHDNDTYTLDLPKATYKKESSLQENIENALGQKISELFVSHNRYICLLGTAEQVLNTKPNFDKLAALPLPGIVITAHGEQQIDFVSRYFAPAKGVPEDPVTGSSHCVLAPFWGDRLNKQRLYARQLSKRSGDIMCELHGDRIHLLGKATLFSYGHIVLNPLNIS